MPIYKMEGKKDGQQKYRVRINFINDSGKAKQIDRVAYGLAAAKDLESKLLQEVGGSTLSPTKLTVADLADEYLKYKAIEIRETSLVSVQNKLKTHVLPYVGSRKITQLNSKVLQNWKLKINDLNLSVSMNQHIYSEFKALLNYAVKMQYISKNPLDVIGTFKDAYKVNSREKIQYYTPSEFKLYIAQSKAYAEKTEDYRFHTFFCIAYFCGLRKGEINALKWSDIDGHILHVKRSIAQKLKGDDRETPPKNQSSYRSLQIPAPLMAVLLEHKQRQMQTAGFTDDYRVAGGEAVLRDTTIDKHNRRYAESANLHRIRIHDFRHSHATLLANEGINIQEIARRLGHAKIEETWNTYSHLYPREEEKAVAILNKLTLTDE